MLLLYCMFKIGQSEKAFNVDTGQWDFGGYSTDKPLDESDEKLARYGYQNISLLIFIYCWAVVEQ